MSYIFFKKHWPTIVAILLCLAFILAGSLVSLNRYWQYEVFYYDFGIFDQAIWKVAHFSAPTIDHLVVGGKWIFADHFNPSIFLFSPLYWLTNRQEILLVAQAVVVGTSGLVLYLIGRKVLRNGLYALAILICYLLFVGLQNAVIFDFHEVTVATLPFLLTFFALVHKRLKLFFLFLIITLGFKESNFLLGVGIGISMFLINRKLFFPAVATCIISILWGFVSIYYIIPSFSGGIYQYSVSFSNIPASFATTLFDNSVKRHTLFISFLSFGFLPIFSYQFWFLVYQDFLTRFYSPLGGTRWTLGLHYNALLAAIMGLSSIYSFALLQKIIPKKIILDILAIILIFNAFVLYRFIVHSPFGLAYNPSFYAHTKDFTFLNTLVEKIPSNASVMAQNNLAVRFDHQTVWTLASDSRQYHPDYYVEKKPQYIVLDARPGQNPNDFFLVTDTNYLLNELQHDPHYKVYYQTTDQYIFKRK